MVHRSTDSRLLANLLEQEKNYSKQLGQVIEASNASLTSFAAYAASSAPPTSHVIMSIAGVLATADESLRSYSRGVDEWREAIRALKDAEEEVGNIMRDREILVTRLIKASKPSKNGSGNIRDSLLLGHQQFPSSSSLSLSIGGGHPDSPSPAPSRPLSSSFSSSTKLAAAQSELQACEAHLAAKERELVIKRSITIRDGLGARIRAMINCGWAWSELGKSALRTLDEIRAEQQEQQSSFMQEAQSRTVAYNTSLSAPELDSTRPSSDFSSIGPSQSASQVNAHHDLPPPVSMTAVMNLAMLGDQNMQGGPSNVQTASNVQRPASHQSSAGSSIFSGPAIPTTYQVETVTYAPAIAVHVPSKESANEKKPEFPSIPMPAPHVLNGYAYDIPTAASPAPGPSQSSQSHSRSQSDYSPPQQMDSHDSKHSTGSGFHVLERRITEDSQEDKLRSSTQSRQDDDVSSFEEVKQEAKLVEEGKLAVVENPRFLTEARKRKLEKEKEREKARKDEEVRSSKEKGKSRAAEDDGQENRERKRFSLFHSSKGSRDQPPTARTPTKSEFAPTTHDERVSPSKGFLGSLRGIFGTKPLVASSSKTSRQVDDGDESDSGTEVSPSKTHSSGLQGLFRNSDNTKHETSGRWQTRTDKNIQQLSSRRSYDDTTANGSRKTGLAMGLSGGNPSHAAVVNAAGIGHHPSAQKATRGRVASDVGASSSRPTATNPGTGKKKLQKARSGRGAGSGVSENFGNASVSGLTTPTQPEAPNQPRASALEKGGRRSASVDPSENRKSWGELEGEEGEGMIIDLGRRRVASEVGGLRAEEADVKAPASKIKKAAAATDVPRATQSEIAGRSVDVFGPNKPIKDYSSDSAATQSQVVRKKSLTKKRGDQESKGATAPSAAQVISRSASAQPSTTVSPAAAPTRKVSIKSTPTNNPSTKTPVSQQTGPATVLAAGGEHPSGVLVSQKGWSAQSQAYGGGLSRNNSAVSSASAPTGGASKSKKATALGQGMGGGGGGVGRRASLMNSPTSANAKPSDSSAGSVIQAQAPAASLMSIVEDVTRVNREGWEQDLKMRKSAGGSQKVTGMFDVVKAPPLVGREKLEALDVAESRNRVTSSPASTTSTAIPSRTGMFEIKAPGSVFDQPQVKTATTPVQRPPASRAAVQEQSATQKAVGGTGSALSTTSSNHRVAQTPLRSAMRGSRSPSPVAGSSRLVRDRNDTGHHEGHSLPAPVDGVLPWGSDGKLNQPRKEDKGKAHAPATPEDTDKSDDESEVFYSDLEEFERKSATAISGRALPPPVQALPRLDLHKTSPHMMGNGHVNGHVAKAPSEVSQSSTSTFLAGQPQSQLADDPTPRRRKSVRVSLQPTFSPSPPAIEYDDEEQQQRHAPWAWQDNRRPETSQRNIHNVVPPVAAPIPTRASTKPAITEHLDMWADSDDEDVQYAQAKRLLTRAAKKEKDVSLMVANRVY